MNNEKKIKVLEPYILDYQKLTPYMRKISKNNQYTNFGPYHNQLISELSSYFNIPEKNIVLLSNASLAIAGAVSVLGKHNRKWLVPSWTFTATPSAIVLGGGIPHFVDIDKDWRANYRKKSANTVDVLPFGDSLRTNLGEFKSDFQIIDGAASFDSLRNLSLPNSGPIGIIISLHATKLISAGEGGIFITNDESWAKNLKAWTNFGFRNGNRISSSLGINAKLSEFNAVVGLVSLSNWSSHRIRLLELTEKILKISNKYGLEVSPAMNKGLATPYWLVKLSNSKQKKDLVKQFTKLNIETRDWWESGCAIMPAFKKFKSDPLIHTNYISNRVIGLPFHLNLSKQDLDRIERGIIRAI